jgi:hypothetical protein
VGLSLLRRNGLLFINFIFTMIPAMTPQFGAVSKTLNSGLREAHFTVIARHVMNFFCLINVHVAKQSHK